jgi:hypothetical protein
MSGKTGLLTPCGSDCGECGNYLGTKQPKCDGCIQLEGKPFWTKETCRVYDCAARHAVAHCGQCVEFPCETFIDQYDPNNSEGPRNAVTRAGILAYRSKHGDQKTLALMHRVQSRS